MRRIVVWTLGAALLLVPVTVAEAKGAGIFRLGGSARHATDPTKDRNQVVSIDTGTASAPQFGFVSRRLDVKVPTLDDQLSVNYYLVPPLSCHGGSPRFTLLIDSDGDGVSNGEAYGYLGSPPNFTGCATGVWLFEDGTDNEREWDLGQFGGGSSYITWDQVEQFFAGFPNHNVLGGVAEADSFADPMFGCSFYDNIKIGNRIWRRNRDTDAVTGTQPNNCPL